MVARLRTAKTDSQSAQVFMAKLTSLPPRVQPLAPRLGAAPGDRRSTDQQRLIMSPWRRWYWSPQWRELRLRAFLRDGFKCQRTGVLCDGRHPAPNSPVPRSPQDRTGRDSRAIAVAGPVEPPPRERRNLQLFLQLTLPGLTWS